LHEPLCPEKKNLKRFFSRGSENGEQECERDELIDGKTEDPEGLGNLVLNGFWGDVQLLGDLFVGQEFETAEVKYLPALFRQRGYGAVQYFPELLGIKIFFGAVVERHFIDMVKIFPGDGARPQVHKACILYRFEKVPAYILNVLMRAFLPQGNKTILHDVFGGITVFHHVQRRMIQFLPMTIEEGGKSPLVSAGNTVKQLIVGWHFVFGQMHGLLRVPIVYREGSLVPKVKKINLNRLQWMERLFQQIFNVRLAYSD
jgi:hypothetical protein